MNPRSKRLVFWVSIGLAVGLIVLPVSDNDSRGLVAAERVAPREHPARVVVAKQAAQAYRSAGEAMASLLGLPLATSEAPVPTAVNIGPPEFAGQYAEAEKLLASVPDGRRWDLICEGDDGTWVVTGATPFAAAHAALTLADWLRWDESMPRPFRKMQNTRAHRGLFQPEKL